MSKTNTKKQIRAASLILFFLVFSIWALFYFIMSDYIANETRSRMTLAADQIIERLGGEFSQVENLLYNLVCHSDVQMLVGEDDPNMFIPLAGKVGGYLSMSATAHDFLEHIIVFGSDVNYYRFAGRLGNGSCARLYDIVSSLELPNHLALDLEGRKYIGYARGIPDGRGASKGFAAILISEEKILEILRMYDQSGSLIVAVKAGGETVAANRHDVFSQNEKKQVTINGRLGITPYEILVTAQTQFMSASVMYFTIVAVITAGIFGVVLFVYTGIINRNFIRAAELRAISAEIEKQKALVFSLKKQINAHFTINTLNTVLMLARRGDLKEAETVSVGLISHIRYAYDKDELINIWDELGILRNYIDIMNSRYDGKLAAQFDFDDRLMNYHMPRMLLQPIVENAVTHGFAGMESGCIISVSAISQNGSVVFTVSDNGRGMSESSLAALNEKLNITPDAAHGFENIALLNIKNRLFYYFGSDGNLSIGANDETGLKVSVSIPLIPEMEAL